jgi:UDP-2,3-diacylglucosamine pyrophosphatase LpxH
MKKTRELDLVVISDIHLGTYGCQAKELLKYLKSIDPKIVILNGDIIDIWQFNKRYFPKPHMKVVKHLLKWIVEGKEIHYLTGNHDEMLRKFKDFELGKFKISNKIVLEMDGKKAWFFHGDVFDVTMQYSKWLTRLGGIGYDFLILLNSFINFVLFKFGRNKLSLSKTIKNSVKGAVKYINRFEKTAVEIAIANGFSYVVCGHIHHPNIKEYKVGDQIVTYLNSGDWIENLTALEYKKGEWSIYKYENNFFEEDLHIEMDKSNKELFNEMLDEFKMMNNQ